MPIQEQHHGFSRQELISAIDGVNANPGQLQLILKNSPGLIREYGGELLSVVIQRCDITTPSGSDCKLLALNICWKVLLAILTDSHVSQTVYELGALFMLNQLRHGVLSHDWTDSKLIKLAAFFASHIAFIVKAHPRYFLCAREYALVRHVVNIFSLVSFTIASSNLDDSILKPLCDNVLLRLKTILEYLGSASIGMAEGISEHPVNGVIMKEENAAVSYDISCCVDLLYQCISEAAVSEIMEAADDGSCFVSMVIATSSLACFLSTVCGLLQKLALIHTAMSRRCTQLLLRALLQWMPSVSFELQGPLHTIGGREIGYNNGCPLQASLALIPMGFEQEEARLMCRIKELANHLPLSALWQVNCTRTENTDDSFDVKQERTESFREHWVHRVVEVLYILLRNANPTKDDTEEENCTFFALSCILMGLATPHFQNTILIMEVYLTLFLQMGRMEHSQCIVTDLVEPGTSLKDEGCAKHLWMLIQVGLLVLNEYSPTIYREADYTNEVQRFYSICKGRIQATLLALIGTGSAVLTGLPPSTLAVHMIPHLGSSLLHVFPAFLNLADYCFFTFTDVYGLQSNLQDVFEMSSAIKGVNDAFENFFRNTSSSEELERSVSVFLKEGCSIALPLALCRLRFAFFAVESFSTPNDERLEQYHTVLSSFQSRFAALTNAVQLPATTAGIHVGDMSNADPIACFLLVSSLLREAAYFPLDVARDKVLVTCIRRWVDLSLQFASCSLAQLQPAFSELLQYHAARILLLFAECNTYVPIEQLNLSETAAKFLMHLLQSLEDKDAKECFSFNSSDGKEDKCLMETYTRYFVRGREWQSVRSLYSHAQSLKSTDLISTDNPVVSALLESIRQCQTSLYQLLQQREPSGGFCAITESGSCDDLDNEEDTSFHLIQKRMRSGDSKKLVGNKVKSFSNPFRAREVLELSSQLRELLRVGHIVDSVLSQTAHREDDELVLNNSIPSPIVSTNATSPFLSLSVEVLSPGHVSTQDSSVSIAEIQG